MTAALRLSLVTALSPVRLGARTRRHATTAAAKLAATLAASLVISACSTSAPGPTAGLPTAADGRPPVLLLGELHDNAAGQTLRLQAIQRLLRDGARPAVLLEQFDRERQAEIDFMLQAAPGLPPGDAEFETTLDALVKLAGPAGAGWDWALVRPVLRLALQYRLLLVAANVSRTDARQVMAQGLAAAGFDAAVPADIASAQATQIVASHCGQIDPAQAGRMALAQVARDQFMARQIERYANRGVLLLAGNGHVRRDLGVPRWLAPGLQQRAQSVGYLEQIEAAPGAFDLTVISPTAPRPDPCASLRIPGAA